MPQLPLPWRRAETVLGVRAAGPAFTPWAAWFFATRFALPVLAVALALDGLLYLVGRNADSPCLSLICWLAD